MLISESIEQFILDLLSEGGETADFQRSVLASQFRCAPSQINYVLQTRFTVERGYIIESRRGGGGYVRVVRVRREALPLCEIITQRLGGDVSEDEARLLLAGLAEMGALCLQAASLLAEAVSDEALGRHPQSGLLRASILRRVLTALLKEQEED